MIDAYKQLALEELSNEFFVFFKRKRNSLVDRMGGGDSERGRVCGDSSVHVDDAFNIDVKKREIGIRRE